MQLPTDISSCHKLILEQQEQIKDLLLLSEQLRQDVKDLKVQLQQNSQNSSKPPSSDGYQKPPTPKPAFDRSKGKSNGGQLGHKGKTLDLSDQVDKVEFHYPSTCSCGCSLDPISGEVKERRQVFNLRDIKLFITEHRQMVCKCAACGKQNQGTFPAEVRSRVQYGAGVKAWLALLSVGYKMPIHKISTLFSDLFGYSINDSTIVEATKKCYDNLESIENETKEQILGSKVAHFDETGLRVDGKLHWLHTVSTKEFTYLYVHKKRGKKALDDTASLLPNFRQWAVHDCWSAYFLFIGCLHAICGAHMLRELNALIEQDSKWAALFKEYLLTLYQLSDKGTKAISIEEQKNALLRFNEICDLADKEEPPPEKTPNKAGKPKASKGRNLLNRLKKYQTAVLAFAFYEEVPFTNNEAERAVRPAKTKQKVSGCFRTVDGANIYARIQGFIATARKKQLNLFEQLKRAFDGKTTWAENIAVEDPTK